MDDSESCKSNVKLISNKTTDEQVRDRKLSSSQRIKFNVGGKLFECFPETLKQFPESKLAKLDDNFDEFYCPDRAFFFDRSPVIFEAILEACRTGELHIPRETCGSTFKRELDFWDISPRYLSPCCWKSFYRAENDTKKIFDLTKYYQENTSLCLLLNQTFSLRTKIWLILDEPRSSKYAKLWAVFMSITVITSLIALSCVSIGSLRVDTRTKEQKETMTFFLGLSNLANTTDKGLLNYYKSIHPGVQITMMSCFVLITGEIFLRIVCCPNVCRYLKCPAHICEIIAAIGFWLYMYIEFYLEQFHSIPGYVFLTIAEISVILQVFRLIRVASNSMAFKVMSLSVSSSLSEIIVLFALLLILVCLFGWLMYIVEIDNHEKFDNFFTAMYWALITLTTVGYGDYFPNTTAGHLIAGACAVSGLVTLALPIGVIAASFNSYYSHHKYVSYHMRTYKPHELEIWSRFVEKANPKNVDKESEERGP